MEQISPIQALLQQRTLLQLEYYTEKEAFRKLTEQMGMQRKVKRGDAWFPLQVGKSFYNSLNQTAIEVFRTSDQDIEHNFEFGRPVMFFRSEKRRVKSEEFNNAANHEVQSSNLKVQSSNLKVQSIRLALYPKTGRTHQLRVHCAHREGLDAPILGDPLYGNVKADRLYLHAEAITFKHPLTGKEIHIERKADF